MSILLFFAITYGLGLLVTWFVKESEDFFERQIMRLGFGLSLSLGHGFGKITQYLTSAGPVEWADPLGLGAGLSLLLAGVAEGIAALMVALGLYTRIAALFPAFVMTVATFVVHADDPWGKKEMAVLFLIAFMSIALAGPGRYSLDALRCRKKTK